MPYMAAKDRPRLDPHIEALANEILGKVSRGEVDRNEMRALASNTIEVAVDAQGRVNIEEKFRGLGAEIAHLSEEGAAR